MLIVMLLAGISVGTMYLVNTESSLVATGLENIQAFYAAEAAMEKMMADLSALYTSQLAPAVADIQELSDPSYQPVISGLTYPQYQYIVPNNNGEPISEIRAISSGPNEGLGAYIVPLTLAVTAAGARGVEVKMERQIQNS